MTHFVTVTVPPPYTDYSEGIAPPGYVSGPDDFEFYDFEKTSVPGHFRELYHTIFGTRVNFFKTSRFLPNPCR
jgi:hypothetical protein